MKLADALKAACQGRQKSLGIDVFGDFGEQEISRVLRGERRPTFALLEAAFDADPEALFSYVAERYGVKVEKPAQPLAAQLELFGAELHSLTERVAEALERAKAQERAPMASVRVAPGEQRGRGRA